MEVRADPAEQRLQVDLLDQHLHVNVPVFPKRERRVMQMPGLDTVHDVTRLVLGRGCVDPPLQVVELARAVLGADVERQRS